MRREHRVLQGVGRILRRIAGAFRDVPQVILVSVKEFGESVWITRDVGAQQLDVGRFDIGVVAALPPEEVHGRILAHGSSSGESDGLSVRLTGARSTRLP